MTTEEQVKKRYDFINSLVPYLDIVKSIPALPSLFLGQSCKEAGFGKYEFYNNYLGIKCHKGVACRLGKTSEVEGGKIVDYDGIDNPLLYFAVYPDREDCAEDYKRILTYVNPTTHFDRYARVRNSRCYQEATYYIKACGYATGPTYDASLRNDYIRPYNLYEFDLERPYKSDIIQGFGYLKWYEAFGTVRLPNGAIYHNAIEPPMEVWPNLFRVAEEFKKIRLYYNRPIGVDSWYRVKDYNDTLKGHSPKSLHLEALAVDLKPLWYIPIHEFYMKVRELTEFKGFGIGANYLHCDLRDKYTTWYY